MLITYLSSFIEFVCIYIITKSFLYISYKPTKNDCIAVLSILLILGMFPQNIPALSWSIGQLLYIIYVSVFTSNNRLNNLFLYCLTFDTLLIVQFFSALIITFIPITLNNEYISILGNSISFVLIILLMRFNKIKSIYTIIMSSALPYRLILLNSYLLLSIMLLVFKINPNELYYNLGIVLVITLFLIATNVCVLYYDQKMNTQQQQLISYQKNLPIYESLIKEIRDNQHEYANRLQNLQNLTATCKDYESLKNSIQTYAYQYAKPLHAYPLLQINMPLLAATLYNLACRAERDGITIQFDVISDKLISKASETELSDFTSTLVQNAIEACTTGDNIYIYLSCTNEQVTFEVRNPIDRFYAPEEISLFFKKDYTTKESILKSDCVPHGIGLYNLIKHVTKINGTIGADCITYNAKHWIVFRLVV